VARGAQCLEGMKLTINIDDKVILSALQSARISSWCAGVDGELRTLMPCAMLTCHDDNEKYHVTRAGLERGLALMATDTKYARAFGELAANRADASHGDLLIQLAAFGEDRYVW
jgi:hypothetical protein